MGEKAESVLKPPSASPGSLRDPLDLPKIFRKEGDDPVGFPVRKGMRHDGMGSEDGHRRKKLKLPALKGSASREGIFFYIVPLDPALKGGAYGALVGQTLRSKCPKTPVEPTGSHTDWIP